MKMYISEWEIKFLLFLQMSISIFHLKKRKKKGKKGVLGMTLNCI